MTTPLRDYPRTPGRQAAAPSLLVRDLAVRFRLPQTSVQAVNDVSFDLEPGTCLALVGESGCGKSVLVGAMLGLLPANADIRGTATLHGPDGTVELIGAPEPVLARQVRGRSIGLIPQSPSSFLTPVRTVRDHLHEVLRALVPHPAGETAARGEATAARAGLPSEGLDRFPHELSGGMAQRAVTALALAGDAWLLLADEPTTGLDRALVQHTLTELRRLTDAGHAVLLITHDLDAARQVADTVAVMYASRIVELGPTAQVLHRPRHPYTRALLNALPRHGFVPIPGLSPELSALPDGCAFAPRCARATERCADRPPLTGTGPGAHHLACHHPC